MKKWIWNFVSHIEDYICTLMMVLMCIATFLQILFRIVIHDPLVWTQELATYCFIWIAFISISWAERNNAHFCVDVFTKRLVGLPRKILLLVDDLLACGFYALLVYWAIQYFPMQAMTKSSAMQISKGVIEVSMILSFGLCLIHRVFAMWRSFGEQKTGGTIE